MTAYIPKVYDIQTDHINTPRVITDASGNEVWRWDSAPFGETAPNEQPTTATSKFTFNFRFPGQYFDAETNLHYNYFRDYDPQAGRYLESDPIGLGGGINTFGYVGGNSLTWIDPFGLQVDINYFTPGTKDSNYANQVTPIPGTFIIAGHGNDSWVVDMREKGAEKGIPAKDLVAEILANKNFKGQKTILILSCFVGADETGKDGKPTGYSYTQDVANGIGKVVKGVEVKAPNNLIDISAKGAYAPRKPGKFIIKKCACGE